MSDDDLFAIPARARRTDPETSHKAAEAIDPHTNTIRLQVEAFAHGRGTTGFIDEQMSKAFEAEDVSSYRTRRAEFVVAGVIVDGGERRRNDGGRECIVWRHRDFAGMVSKPLPKPVTKRPEDLRGHFQLLDNCVDQMRREGWLAAGMAKEALDAIRKAVRQSD